MRSTVIARLPKKELFDAVACRTCYQEDGIGKSRYDPAYAPTVKGAEVGIVYGQWNNEEFM